MVNADDASTPVLLIDVDGPLNPYAAPPHRRPEGYTTHRWHPEGWHGRKPLRVWLNPDHGPALLALPYLPFPDSPSRPDARLFWKTKYVVEWAGGQPFVWIDDDTTRYDQEYVDQHHDGFGRILHIKPHLGLQDEDFAVLNAWAPDAVAATTTKGEPR